MQNNKLIPNDSPKNVRGVNVNFNVCHISEQYNFVVNGVSYIGNPQPHTAMFASKKAEKLLANLYGVSSCLVFVEKGILVDEEIMRHNCFVFSDCPQREYARFANGLYTEWLTKEKKRNYEYTKDGYYRGENVKIGLNSYIEPGCLIGHDVSIGDNAVIMSGAVIKKSTIGNNVIINEKAAIGTFGFTMTEDECGHKLRIPTLGNVQIGNEVEIGAYDNISCGSGGDTIIDDYVKLDALVYIGHDAHLCENVEITAGSIIGGFANVECEAYIGINSSVRNRITVGKNSIIGMGSTVTKSVKNDVTVLGNPAKIFVKD